MIRKFFNYGLIGLVNTLFSYAIIFYLIYINIFPEVANFIGYGFGFLLSYILNKKYNFKSSNSHKKDFPKFLLSMIVAYILNLLTLMLLYRVFKLDIYLSQVIASIVYTLVGFYLSSYIFKEKENSK